MTNQQVRVLVLESFAATATNPVQVYGRGATWTIDGVDATFPVDARLRFTPTVSGATTTWKVLVTATDGSTLYERSARRAASASGPGPAQPSSSGRRPSAYDRFRGVLRLIGKTDGTSTVNVVNELPMESYLQGVVPAEISAGLAGGGHQGPDDRRPLVRRVPAPSDDRHVRRLQRHALAGVLRLPRREADDERRRSTATAGKVLRTSSGGKVTALFHSAAGGATENNENVFVSATGAKTAGVYSYLRGSMRPARRTARRTTTTSPYTTWKTKTYTLAQIQAWFAADARSNVGTLVAIDLRDRGVSGRLISVTLIGADGTTKKVSGGVFRSIFNDHRPSGDAMLRSTLFDLEPIP